MLNFLNNSSIKKTTFLLIIFSGIFAFAFAFLVIFNEKIELAQNIKQAKDDYIREKKDIIISENLSIYNIIKYHESRNLNNEELVNIIKAAFEESQKPTFSFIMKDKNIIYESLSLSSLTNEDNTNLLIKIQNTQKNEFFNVKKNDKKAIIYAATSDTNDYIVGVGIFLDDFEKMILNKKIDSDYKITSFVLKIITLTFILYGISIMKYRYLARMLQDELKRMDRFFTQAAKTYQFIEKDKIHLDEFKEIATHANSMLAIIKNNTDKLESLNANLEKIIDDKTSELKQSVELSNRLLKDQDRFINNAIHEINTPLSIILLNTEMYHLKYEKNSYFCKIQVAVKVLESINEDLNYIAKKDRANYPRAKLDMSEILRGRVEYFLDIARQNELSFKVEIEDEKYIFFNEIELIRILDNNLSNAIKYAYEKSEIFISLISKDDIIKFVVENKSDKIKSVEKIFSRFYRENEATGGFGLGLNIVREICNKNGVKINVSSKDSCTKFEYEFEQI